MDDRVCLSLRSGKRILQGDIPASAFAGVFRPARHGARKLLQDRFEEALSHPRGGLCLEHLARAARNVLILCDDATRPTPTAEILVSMVSLIERTGLPAEKIRILFATGTHRALSEQEARAKIGKDLWGRISWESHDWKGSLTRMGWTSAGAPVDVNSRLAEADLVIGIGSVFPHRYCGWSGGGKLVLPGISGQRSILRAHMMPYYDPSICLGSPKNRAITESREAARIAGLRFLIQVVCDGTGEVYALEAGEPGAAHDAAIARGQEVFSAKIDPADIVIASAWPEDSDLWQAGKALYAAELAVKEGGLIVLVTDLREGVGPHSEYALLLRMSSNSIRSGMETGHFRDPLAAAAAFVTRRVMEKARIILVTSAAGGDVAREASLDWSADFQETLNMALGQYSQGRLALLEEAPLILPLSKEEER